MIRLAVLASGSGTNLEAILKYPLPVALVVTDRACGAVQTAAEAGVPCITIPRPRKKHLTALERRTFTAQVRDCLVAHSITHIAMAGFFTVLSEQIFDAYGGRMLNLHPSLLPKYKGAHAVRDALESGESVTGCTIHVVTPVVDHGRILAQCTVPIRRDDTVETLHERIKQVERRLFPKTVARFLQETQPPA